METGNPHFVLKRIHLLQTYVLFPFPSDDNPEARTTRCRGLTRGIRQQMPADCFVVPKPDAGAERRPEKIYFNNYAMHPSVGGQVVISLKRRCMTNALNTKRRLCEVV